MTHKKTVFVLLLSVILKSPENVMYHWYGSVIFYQKFFPLISPDIVNINELTLILKSIGQCNIKRIMVFPIKTIKISFEGLNIHYL